MTRPDDPHRPLYHFTPPANWMNDPNGLIQWNGQYHLFYQYNPNGPFWGDIHWGHAVSPDLVHWTDLPVALAPTPGGVDQDGCFSGCAVVHDRVPTFVYTGVRGEAQLPCLATALDDDLVSWEKYSGNPVIAAPPREVDALIFRDHSVWNEAGTWYQLVGSGIPDAGGTALLFRSHDLIDWEYLNPVTVGDRNQTEPVRTGEMWECPAFVELDGGHALIVSAMDHGDLRDVVYLTGDYADHRLTPHTYGMVDAGRSFYAPQVFTDDQGRRIMFGWLQEARSREAQIAAGWSGAMSLPRLLTLLPDGALGMAPAPELEALRRNHRSFADIEISSAGPGTLDGVTGDSLEIVAVIEPGDAAEIGLEVRVSPDGEEKTTVAYDREGGSGRIDVRQSNREEDARSEPRPAGCGLLPDGSLRLHLFLDRSVVELFANDRACVTERIYPSRPDSLGVSLFALGGTARLKTLDVWDVDAIWSADRTRS